MNVASLIGLLKRSSVDRPLTCNNGCVLQSVHRVQARSRPEHSHPDSTKVICSYSQCLCCCKSCQTCVRLPDCCKSLALPRPACSRASARFQLALYPLPHIQMDLPLPFAACLNGFATQAGSQVRHPHLQPQMYPCMLIWKACENEFVVQSVHRVQANRGCLQGVCACACQCIHRGHHPGPGEVVRERSPAGGPCRGWVPRLQAAC